MANAPAQFHKGIVARPLRGEFSTALLHFRPVSSRVLKTPRAHLLLDRLNVFGGSAGRRTCRDSQCGPRSDTSVLQPNNCDRGARSRRQLSIAPLDSGPRNYLD